MVSDQDNGANASPPNDFAMAGRLFSDYKPVYYLYSGNNGTTVRIRFYNTKKYPNWETDPIGFGGGWNIINITAELPSCKITHCHQEGPR